MSDSWVARNGTTFNASSPGHLKVATLDYLLKQNVNIIVGHPQIVENDYDRAIMTDTPDALGYLRIAGANPYEVAHLFKILEVRLDAGHRLFMAYLNRNPAVDEAIKKNGWLEYDFAPMKKEMQRSPGFPDYRPGTRIDFTSADANKYLWYGWAAASQPYRWTNRPHAAISFHLDVPAASQLEMNLEPFIVQLALPKQRVTIQLNGTTLTTWDLTEGQIQTRSVDLPLALLRSDNVLTFDLPDAKSPVTLGVGEDTSLLAINVRWLQILPKGQ